MSHPIKSPRKLIEVALPLDAISLATAGEKSIRQGHPSALHQWWSRKPLAAARAVLFAQLVNDPGYQQGGGFKYGLKKKEATEERKRLFKIIEDLVLWENTTNEDVLERARAEIRRSWREVCDLNKDHPQAAELFNPNKLPAFHDPFAGGGAIPLEALRLGLEAWASDLNPVAVLINKAMIEIPPKFTGRPPVSLVQKCNGAKGDLGLEQTWPGATGLAIDVRHYGAWMRDEAEKRIGHLYPKIEITAAMAKERPDLKPLAGQKLTVIAWLWARTVKSPNPAFSHVDVPISSTFVLSSNEGKGAYVQPVIEGDHYRFAVKLGTPPPEAKKGTMLARGSFGCLLSGTPMGYAYIDYEANAKRMGTKLMAIVAAGPRGRVYLPPPEEAGTIANTIIPSWKPETPCRGTFASNAQGRIYGFKVFGDYFSPRQLVALTTFSDLVGDARELIRHDALVAGIADDGRTLDDGGTGATAYADALSVYLAFALSKQADLGNSLCRWEPIAQCPRNLFGRQAIQMIWGFAEGNPLGNSSGGWEVCVDGVYKAFVKAFEKVEPSFGGTARQADASTQDLSRCKVVSTDPPYYDNISYADLSDFFYVWLRRSLKPVFPDLFSTLAVPKAEELVATPYRHGSKEKAESFFLDGMTRAMHRLAAQAHPAFPVTIYYAFKQSETEKEGTSSTGWETFLDALIQADFALTGTWPMRTENSSRLTGQGTTSLLLASSLSPASAPPTRQQSLVASSCAS